MRMPSHVSSSMRIGSRAALLRSSTYSTRIKSCSGGGLSNIARLYHNVNVPALVERYAFSDIVDTPIVRARHGDSRGVRGAAWLWPVEWSEVFTRRGLKRPGSLSGPHLLNSDQ
jgi:ROK family